MNTLDFLRRVLPTEGLYVSVVVNAKYTRQGFYDSIDKLSDAVTALSDSGNNVYYAVASFADRAGGRKQSNVHLLKALYLDVDCGEDKPFFDWKDGLKAIGKFIADTGLPKPMIVRSGNGLHVYWVLDREYSRAEWQPVAEMLKASTSAHNFEVDPAVPADSARVLRAVGTINPKGGNTVTKIIDASPVDLETLKNILSKYVPTTRVFTTKPKTSSLLDNLAVTSDYPEADPSIIVNKCAQLTHITTNQKDISEPLWYAALGVAAYCINPEQTAIEWSQYHPSFDPNETIRKMEQAKANTTGPSLCSRFESENPNGCKGCVFKDRVSTPARLSVNYAAIDPDDNAPDDIVKTIAVPWPFKRTASGMKMTINDVDTDVCKFDIYPVGYGRDETLGYETVRYRWNRPHVGWQPLIFRQAYLNDTSREFAGCIADQGIVLQNRKQTENFQYMLRSYMDELRQLRSMSNLYASMGWKEGNTQFLLGDNLFKQDATGSAVQEQASFAANTHRTVEPMFISAGSVDGWAKFTSLIEKANMPIHGFALLVSMSSPLYKFTGLKGLTINLYGPTGAGKTLAQYWQQSVWGDPEKLHYTAKFTQNALYARMGLYNNLPVTIDETTMMQSKDVGDFLYSVSQGKEKARLNRNAEERDTKTWSTVVTTSSNRSMSSMLVASGLETDAQMARLLEITVEKHPLLVRSTEAGQKMYEFITTNYGTVGPAIIKHLMELGEDNIRLSIQNHKAMFYAQYNCEFTGSERYWEQAILLADYIGKIAKSLDLIQFNHSKCIEHVLKQIGAMRKAVKENSVDAFDVITEYINEHSGNTITVMHTGTNKPQPNSNRIPRGSVCIRFDLYRPTQIAPFDRGTVLFDRKHFRMWLATKGGDYRSLVREITMAGVQATPQSEKAFLGKDTDIKLGQQYVLGVSLNHPRLAGVLNDADDATMSAPLNVIQGGKN